MTKKEAELYREAAYRQGYYFGVKHAHSRATTGLATEGLVHEALGCLTQASDALNAYKAARAKK